MSFQIKNYMRKDIATIDVEYTAAEASKMMMDKVIGYLIVLERGKPTGIVTERDLVLKIMAKQKDPLKVKVSEIMSTPLVTIDPDTTLEDAVSTMVKHGIRRLPVVRQDILYGVFTARDLAKHFNEYENRVRARIWRRMYYVSLPF